jgi:putative transposase
MRTFRRAHAAGGTYFFTVVTAGRRPLLDEQTHVRSLRRALFATQASHPFAIDALVVLPDHLHCVWTLPQGDSDYSLRWQLVKKRCARQLEAQGLSDHRGGLWQPRFWEHLIRDADDLARHIDYIHYNPVRHGLVSRPGEWPFSSFHRFARAGTYATGWGEAVPMSIRRMPLEQGEPRGSSGGPGS